MSASITDTDAGAGPAPRLSVVIASTNEGSLLERCVDALASQAKAPDVELIVVRALDRPIGDSRRALAARAPVRWIDAPGGTTVPRLRGLGIAAARGELIALLEDDCEAEAGWCRAALTETRQAAAIGGAVEPGPYRRALDWAVYFCEYGRFMLPVPADPDSPLPGNNLVCARHAIDGLAAEARSEFREVFVQSAWRLEGVQTGVSGTLVVRNVNRWTVSHVTSVPFHHGRAYAAQRFGVRSPAVRAAFATITPALPMVKAARIIAATVSRRRLVAQLTGALPWMMVFLASWSAGELVGCVLGPGDSATRWR